MGFKRPLVRIQSLGPNKKPSTFVGGFLLCLYLNELIGCVVVIRPITYSADDEIVFNEPPVHPNCRCVIEAIQAIFSGYATSNGRDGADYWLKKFGELPNYYIERMRLRRGGGGR